MKTLQEDLIHVRCGFNKNKIHFPLERPTEVRLGIYVIGLHIDSKAGVRLIFNFGTYNFS